MPSDLRCLDDWEWFCRLPFKSTVVWRSPMREGMMTNTSEIDCTESQIRISKNYLMIIIGCFFFPFMVVVMLSARKAAKFSTNWKKSHLIFQYRTSLISLIISAILSICIAIMFYVNRGEIPLRKNDLIYLSYLFYFVYLWVIVRSVKAFLLLKSRRSVKDPYSFGVWPS